MRQWIGTWRPGTYRFEASDYCDLGDKVLVRCTEYGLGRGSGVEVRRQVFQLWDMRDGKAISVRCSSGRPKPSKPPGCRGRRCRRRT